MLAIGKGDMALTSILGQMLHLSETNASCCLEKAQPSLGRPRRAGTKACSALRANHLVEELAISQASHLQPWW